MLDAIRKRTGSIAVKILLAFLVLSFGVWGIGDYIQGGAQQTTAVTVGEREISTYRLSNELQREANRLRRFLGNTVTTDTLRTMGLDRELINRLVRAELFSIAAEAHDLVVSDDRVRAEITDMQAFNGLSGAFDPDVFRQAIAAAGYSEAGFIEIIRDEIRRAIMLESLNMGAVVPDAALRRIHAYRNETRSARFISIPDAAFTDIDQPDETAIQAYHRDNEGEFMAPEYRDVTFIHLRARDLIEGIDVREQDIEESYAERENEFVTIARRNVEQGIFATEAEAWEAIHRQADGEGFADAVSQISGSSANTLGWVMRGDLFGGDDVADAVFGGDAGDVVGPVKSPLGWHVFNIIEAEDEIRQPLDEVRQVLRDDLAVERALDDLFELANELEDLLGSGLSLEDAGEAIGVAATNIPKLSRDGVDDLGNTPADMPSQDFLSTVFATQEGSESPLLESGGDAYFIVRVNDITAPVLRPLESVRQPVINALMADERATKAREAAESVSKTLRIGSDFGPIADLYGGSISAGDSIRRDGSGLPEGITQGTARALFATGVGQSTVIRGDGAYVVGLVTAESPAVDGEFSASFDSFRAEMNRAIRNDVIEQFSAALQRDYPVTINENAVRHAQGLY